MKILPIDKYILLDKHTTTNCLLVDELISEVVDGFEKAVLKLEEGRKDKHVQVICGLGTNGVDGLAIAGRLHKIGFKTQVIILKYKNDYSHLFLKYLSEIQKEIEIIEVKNSEDLSKTNFSDILVDCIFGTGLNRPLEGLPKEAVKFISNSSSKVISLDLPSGFFSDEINSGVIVRADHTLTLGLPKLGLFFAENYEYVGEWGLIPLSLSREKLEKLEPYGEMIDRETVGKLISGRKKFTHKGTYGKALLVGGSYGLFGSILMAAQACIRSGVGYTFAYIPRSGSIPFQSRLPEVIVKTDIDEYELTGFETLEVDTFSAIGLGPGLGKKYLTVKALKNLFDKTQKPVVADADALNLIAEHKLFNLIPSGSILTPHLKEFQRIVNSWKGYARHSKDSKKHFLVDSKKRLELAREFSAEFNVFLVLKGAHTVIASPDSRLFFNSTGNPGMAKAGTGDVLTGILTGLLAQGYSGLDTCHLGVFLHGLAADLAVNEYNENCLLPTDIIKYINPAFREIDSYSRSS
jgi:ADP-dependent NAD(P)H-hydrate dehydratase / NAD(P)H-hydrate epimerase